jgi:hypothetical protein
VLHTEERLVSIHRAPFGPNAVGEVA